MTAPSRPDRNADRRREERAARRGRYSLYIAGGFFVAVGIVLDTLPALALAASGRVAEGCALFGAMILAVGRFAPDRVVRRCDALPTRRT